MKYFAKLLLLLSLLFFTACESPAPFGKKVKKEYFTNGEVRSEFSSLWMTIPVKTAC